MLIKTEKSKFLSKIISEDMTNLNYSKLDKLLPNFDKHAAANAVRSRPFY